MTIILIIVGVLASFGIFLQDFKDRAIQIWLFLLLGGIGLCYRLMEYGSSFYVDPIVNLILIGGILGGIWIWFTIRGKGQLMDQQLGWGDVVMLISLGCWMDTRIFIPFYAFCCLALCSAVLLLLILKVIPRNYPIPLAGVLGLVFGVCFPIIVYLEI